MLVLVDLTPIECAAIANGTCDGMQIASIFNALNTGVVLNHNARDAARLALLAYVQWYSEEYYAAGWLSGINEQLAGTDQAYDFLRRVAGGYWHYRDDFREDS